MLFSGHISRFDRLESTRRYFASRGIGIEQSLESERFEYDKLFVYVDDKVILILFVNILEMTWKHLTVAERLMK